MKFNYRIILIFLIILIVLFSATIIIFKVLKINDSSPSEKEIIFDFDSRITYKKAVNALPYCLDPLKEVNVNKKSSEKKYQQEILNFLTKPFINSEPEIEKKENELIVNFKINQNLTFENGEKINNDIICNTIKNYLDHDKNKFSSENKIFHWLLRLKNAFFYYHNKSKSHKDKKLTCFEKKDKDDDLKFTLIFHSTYLNLDDAHLTKNITNWVNNLVLLSSQYENNFQNYGEPQNNFVSYGEYKVKKYIPEKGLLLENINLDNKNIKNIFYQVITDEQKKFDDFYSGRLNELELTSKPKDESLEFIYIPASNDLLALFLNQGERNDASFFRDENIKKGVPTIIRNDNFKKALIKIIQKNRNSEFIEIEHIDNDMKKIYLENIPEDINYFLQKAYDECYDEWQQKNPSQSILVLELVCEDEPQKKEIAFFLKEQIEQNLNLDIKDKIKIEVKYFPLYTDDITLAEFQCVYDLIITSCRTKEYFSLLEKINLSDLIKFKLNFSKDIEPDQIEKIKNEFKLPHDLEFNTLEIKNIYEKCQQEINQDKELNKKLLISLQKCLQETIEKNKSFLPLLENKKYIVYQKSNELFENDDILELLKKQQKRSNIFFK
ncbi:MAG: hypothetical protein ACLTFB_01285 [Candidatus Phytoplasma pyri]